MTDPTFDTVRRAAIQWQVILWSGETTAKEQADFEAWYHACETHAVVWHQLQDANQQWQQLPPTLGQALRQPRTRRRTLLGAGAAITLGLLFGAGHNMPAWRRLRSDYHTATGQQQRVHLADGSLLVLNTDSAVTLEYDAHVRRIVLERGEIHLESGTDPGRPYRPLLVATRAGTVRALGTRFTVRELDDEWQSVRVQVHEGAVAITPQDGSSLRLESGRQVDYHRSGIGMAQAITPAADAWLYHRLVAEHMPLGQFVAELARYRNGILRCDPAIASLSVSGVYPLDDTDTALQALQQVHPIRIGQLTPYWVTIRPD